MSLIDNYMDTSSEKRYTVDDYLNSDENEIWTLIEGVKITSPSPNLIHQDFVFELYSRISEYSKKKGLGKTIGAPFDVFFDQSDVVQPDVLLVMNERKNLVRLNGVFGAPDLCVEVVSPSSVAMDTLIKKDLYERFGVKEYWIVFPAERVIEIFTLEDGRFVLASHCDGEGSVSSRLLPGFTVAVADLWNQEA
jgi:Uma2 family endonuclease